MAGDAAARGLNLPRSRRRYRFALTPLADAMFQLLIFFMLSSSITPYSMLTLQSHAAATDTPGLGSEPGAEPAANPLPGEAALWNIENGEVIVGGQRFGFDSLADLAGVLRDQGTADVYLLPRQSAEVQDIVSVLEALSTAGIDAVQIVTVAAP